ncbi:MAG: GNAT family N-acetyltransferase [Coriobacteriales bacterium]|jgi:GNAT superfamily N-acetyltransferase|nr:GNAT family N-acetyltransferase [Coriobacteriales bacterium]
MRNITAVEVSPQDTAAIERLAQLAGQIWHQHFPQIIGEAQTSYMVGLFQSFEAIRAQLASGYRYFFLMEKPEDGSQPATITPGATNNAADPAGDTDAGLPSPATGELAITQDECRLSAASDISRLPLLGYFGIQLRTDTDELHLSKLYVSLESRGTGAGSFAIQTCRELARAAGLSRVTLTCNKYNTNTLAFYKQRGFTITDDVVTDIGNGYVMDDYIMELAV